MRTWLAWHKNCIGTLNFAGMGLVALAPAARSLSIKRFTKGLGYAPPEFAHIPIVAINGKKMSKRDIPKYVKIKEFADLFEKGKGVAQRIGLISDTEDTSDVFNPVLTDFYRDIGYLNDALINYLLLLAVGISAIERRANN